MASNDLVEKIGLNTEEIVGYLYSGTLLGLLWWKLRPDEVTAFCTAVGSVEFALGLLLLGPGIYCFYFRVIGDLVVFPIQHRIHRVLDRLSGRTTSPVRLVAHMGVGLGSRRAAFNLVKSEFLDEGWRNRTALHHAEMQVLYITAVELLGAAALSAATGAAFAPGPLMIWGLAALTAAIVADTKQHRRDTQLIERMGDDALRAFLEDEGFLIVR